MKWPRSLMLIRHDTSAYNELKAKKESDELYKRFKEEFETDHLSPTTRELAEAVREKFALSHGDAATPLANVEGRQARMTGERLSEGDCPDVIFVSPYKRALSTLEHMKSGWPALKGVKVYQDERVREQDHGLALLYSDWRVFHTFHPEQKELYELEGPYWYRYPQGENVPDVRARNRSWLTTLSREFLLKKVMVVTHHLNILATRSNLERLDEDGFRWLDANAKPINCGVTLYLGNSRLGANGRLTLDYYNKKFY